jgi:DNA-directed RNA polymerase specialized sigma24 family protein
MNDVMIQTIAWIAAAAEKPKGEDETLRPAFSTRDVPVADLPVTRISLTAHEIANLPAHQFPAKSAPRASPPVAGEAKESESAPYAIEQTDVTQEEAEFRDDDRERRIYRGRTVGMLRRYMRYSIETGRLPSLLGREFFRTQVTKYQVSTFEDRVIFVHDMDRCLDQLDEFSREVLGRIVLQEYEHEEAARLMGCTRMTVHRKLIEALDRLSEILVTVGLLDALGSNEKKSCQGGKSGDFPASDCERGK